jgi:hypothetical protein
MVLDMVFPNNDYLTISVGKDTPIELSFPTKSLKRYG